MNKFANMKEFFACVDQNGIWFDSAQTFENALHWCVAYEGHHDMETEEALKLYMNRTLKSRVIHSSMIPDMKKAGIIK